ncbi:hypothetical protein [Vibrio sp. Vb1337]|uniref:hypothetical protein n=1 Tax=Vibrio sp. Vb1337 TaxID=3074641 RepID=UPI00296514BC|nr:hypothetical protein [Vibrio sp. Vb1337]MDW1898795.1 hypothetical protein [Vibrio sp. Vb1337]
MPIFIGIAALVFVGLIFGFHIQVSTSFINVITSIGTLLGGFGAAYAAYLARQSVGEWRDEFHYKNTYSQLSEFESMLKTMLEDFTENSLSKDSLTTLSNTAALQIPLKILHPYRERYQRLHEDILNGLSSEGARAFKELEYSSVCAAMSNSFLTGLSNYQRLTTLAKDIDESEHNVEEKGQQLTADMAEYLKVYKDYRQHVQRYLKIVRDIRTSL